MRPFCSVSKYIVGLKVETIYISVQKKLALHFFGVKLHIDV